LPLLVGCVGPVAGAYVAAAPADRGGRAFQRRLSALPGFKADSCLLSGRVYDTVHLASTPTNSYQNATMALLLSRAIQDIDGPATAWRRGDLPQSGCLSNPPATATRYHATQTDAVGSRHVAPCGVIAMRAASRRDHGRKIVLVSRRTARASGARND